MSNHTFKLGFHPKIVDFWPLDHYPHKSLTESGKTTEPSAAPLMKVARGGGAWLAVRFSTTTTSQTAHEALLAASAFNYTWYPLDTHTALTDASTHHHHPQNPNAFNPSPLLSSVFLRDFQSFKVEHMFPPQSALTRAAFFSPPPSLKLLLLCFALHNSSLAFCSFLNNSFSTHWATNCLAVGVLFSGFFPESRRDFFTILVHPKLFGCFFGKRVYDIKPLVLTHTDTHTKRGKKFAGALLIILSFNCGLVVVWERVRKSLENYKFLVCLLFAISSCKQSDRENNYLYADGGEFEWTSFFAINVFLKISEVAAYLVCLFDI